ncbi:MAG: carbonate dehydratase [Planctomycetota bacterium]|nr:carbonate dehydratase [Planctomycetota bacterium]
MRLLDKLFENNRAWADGVCAADPTFFHKLAEQQAPDYLWIGCSDSRVPANQIVGLDPGEVFVHRNVANIVLHADLNCMSVIQFAVDVLKVEHIIVCGHYGCGGVRAAMNDDRLGLVDFWIRHVRDVARRKREELLALQDEDRRWARLCELNVLDQVANVCHSSIVQDAWAREQPLAVHGWIYDVADGRLRDLNACITSRREIDAITKAAQRL